MDIYFHFHFPQIIYRFEPEITIPCVTRSGSGSFLTLQKQLYPTSQLFLSLKNDAESITQLTTERQYFDFLKDPRKYNSII